MYEKMQVEHLVQLQHERGLALISIYVPALQSKACLKRGIKSNRDVIKMLASEIDRLMAPEVNPNLTAVTAEVIPEPAQPLAFEDLPADKQETVTNLRALCNGFADLGHSPSGTVAFAGRGEAIFFSPPNQVKSFAYVVGETYHLEPLMEKPEKELSDGVIHDHVCTVPGHPTVCHFEMLLDDLLYSDDQLGPEEILARKNMLEALKRMNDKAAIFQKTGGGERPADTPAE